MEQFNRYAQFKPFNRFASFKTLRVNAGSTGSCGSKFKLLNGTGYFSLLVASQAEP